MRVVDWLRQIVNVRERHDHRSEFLAFVTRDENDRHIGLISEHPRYGLPVTVRHFVIEEDGVDALAEVLADGAKSVGRFRHRVAPAGQANAERGPKCPSSSTMRILCFFMSPLSTKLRHPGADPSTSVIAYLLSAFSKALRHAQLVVRYDLKSHGSDPDKDQFDRFCFASSSISACEWIITTGRGSS